MLPIFATLVFFQSAPVVTQNPGDLNPLIDHYKSLKGLTYTVIHHGDVGDPKKEFAERVYWVDGRFEITPIGYQGAPPPNMTKLVCNDKQITSLAADGTLNTGPLDPGPDAVGTWEARGGLILSWLMGGKSWKRMTEPKEGLIQKFTFKGAKTWHERPVKEVVLTHNAGIYGIDYSIFISPKGDELIGTEYTVNGVDMWTEYKDEAPITKG
jgi:hypothetical protein